MTQLVQQNFNNTLQIAANLNISHTLGMVDLANIRDRAVYTKVHQLMFDTIRIHNTSAAQVSSIAAASGGYDFNMITQNPATKMWSVLMRDYKNSSCLVEYSANVSLYGEYVAEVDYDSGSRLFDSVNGMMVYSLFAVLHAESFDWSRKGSTLQCSVYQCVLNQL